MCGFTFREIWLCEMIRRSTSLYDGYQEYVETLEHWVKSGDLIEGKEFYSSVRLRGAKARDLLEKEFMNFVCLISIRLHLMEWNLLMRNYSLFYFVNGI